MTKEYDNYILYWHGKKITNKTVLDKSNTNWSGRKFFVSKLNLLEQKMINDRKYYMLDKKEYCIECKQEHNKNLLIFKFGDDFWRSDLIHDIVEHYYQPPAKFIRFILNNDPTIIEKCKKSTVKMNGKLYRQHGFTYLKVKSNQLLILDALLEHGGYSKKYKMKHDKGFKFSEHAGMLDFNQKGLERIIVSGITDRSVDVDPEIFFPQFGQDAYDFEYIFHTHPPTPRIGGRIDVGILYEFPSANDIYHFAEHFNNGHVQGSIILTAEGLYNIRKYYINNEKINLSTTFGKELKKIYRNVQMHAIDQYGDKFTDDFFYGTIAQNTSYIDECNEYLKKKDIYIDFFPRQKNKSDRWIIGTIYLPMCVIEKI